MRNPYNVRPFTPYSNRPNGMSHGEFQARRAMANRNFYISVSNGLNDGKTKKEILAKEVRSELSGGFMEFFKALFS